MRNILRVGAAILAATALLGLSTIGDAGAQSACAALGGTLTADQHCDVVTTTATHVVEIDFATTYPDQQSVADYLLELRDGFAEFAQSPPAHEWPYTLAATSTTQSSGTDSDGTQSLVLQLSQDANPRPVTWYKTFNYDLASQTPITLATLFRAGVDPVDIIFPAVQRELEKRWQPDVLADMLGDVGESTFENFALTDDAVIFYFGQGQLLGHPEGPIEVSVPRTELAPSFA